VCSSDLDQLLGDNPNDLEIEKFEAVPGITEKREIRLRDFNSMAVLVFAAYDESLPGIHKTELKNLCKNVKINLGRNSITVTY
jgi:hypothetical protein